MSVEIIEFEDRFTEELCQLQTLHWSSDPSMNRRYFHWKYRAGPGSEASRLYLAISGGRVIGVRGYFGARWILSPETKPTIVLTAADLVVHPDFRGTGISRSLLDWSRNKVATETFPFLMNLSASKVNRIELLAAGWRSLGRFTIWNRLPRLAGTLRRVGINFGPGLAGLDGAKVPPGSTIETEPRCAAMASLAGRAPTASNRLERDEAFFRWRFANPLSEYRFLYLGEDSLQAYLVVQRWREHDREWINLIDYACVEPSHLKTLVSIVVDACGMHCLRTWEPAGKGLQQVLADLGFHAEKRSDGVRDPRPSMLVQPIDHGAESNGELLDFSACERAMVLSDYY